MAARAADGNIDGRFPPTTISSDTDHTNTTVVETVKYNGNQKSTHLVSSTGASLSTTADHASEIASIHSMPEVLVTETPRPTVRRPSTATSPPPAPRPENQPESTPTQSYTPSGSVRRNFLRRRARYRSAIEVRYSNRFSDFFNNLIRREPPLASFAPETITEGQNTANIDKAVGSASPVSTPVVPLPPSLPPPSLQELGLSLSILTSDLSPTHFSTPPASGIFLAPRYLLLCHAQGLDVLPLTSPPASQPYALVRRVAFKSVVVMEYRGILVAIAGRRDGVRVYALEEVKKAIEWRIDVETRRERERLQRELAKQTTSHSGTEARASVEKMSLSIPTPTDNHLGPVLQKASHRSIPHTLSAPLPPLVPRAPRTPTRSPKKIHVSPLQVPQTPVESSSQPPPYANSADVQSIPALQRQPSAVSVRARAQNDSVNYVLAGVSVRAHKALTLENHRKSDDWAGSSDDEAIDIRAAAGGSEALDERTSATLSASRNASSIATRPYLSTTGSQRQRPSNLDLSATHNTSIPNSEPSPTPTLLTLRQALRQPPLETESPDPCDVEDDDDETDGRISLAQALMESRIPDLPPPGTTQIQEPILINTTHNMPQDAIGSFSSEGHDSIGIEQTRSPRRRRWSLMPSGSSSMRRPSSQQLATSSFHLPRTSYGSTGTNDDQIQGNAQYRGPPSLHSDDLPISTVQLSKSMDPLSHIVSPTSIVPSSSAPTNSRSRFFSRIISTALNRRSDERLPPTISAADADTSRWLSALPPPPLPPPKLQYLKLPGTKGALMIKAVETPRKSFLAILCGENGEKVELFAGTYRTALGLLRTFILPDSPRSLELQLQGDDLVEIFLVFAQNVFGLEPATVRVREVRIGRAERRVARRQARENRLGEVSVADHEANEDDINASTSLDVTITSRDGLTQPSTPPLVASEHSEAQDELQVGHPESAFMARAPTDEFITMQMGPYTTFQQLRFAPQFPLASIADEFVIPPTYPHSLSLRGEHESDEDDSRNHGLDHRSSQFTPPGLPAPTPSGPTHWYYKDPKGVMHGPWSSNLMQAWYQDGLLPSDLPVRREEETDYTFLRDLKLQCIDPAHPFRSPLPPCIPNHSPNKLLLPPISLLSQPKYSGPPALFFSSRGGHSTTIVDTRGRSVLKGRFVWSNEEFQDEVTTSFSKMGDVKHLEALDVKNRSVLVAMRRGGLEVVDLNDALLRPADQSRTALPTFHPPLNAINRRPPFVWRIGTSIDSFNAPLSTFASKGKAVAPRKVGLGINNKSAGGPQGFVGAEADCDPNDDVLFLGRKDDDIYFCERKTGSFRILRLCPDTNNEC